MPWLVKWLAFLEIVGINLALRPFLIRFTLDWFGDLLTTGVDLTPYGLPALNASEALVCGITSPCSREGRSPYSSSLVAQPSG